MSRNELVNRLRCTIKGIVPDAQAILFGSEARGEAKRDSDIDLLILVRIRYLP